jgi:hypothetical protein
MIPHHSAHFQHQEILETSGNGRRPQLFDSMIKKSSKDLNRQPVLPRRCTRPLLSTTNAQPLSAQTPSPSGKVFDRLFEYFTSKKKMPTPESDPPPLIPAQPLISTKSIQIAQRLEIAWIKSSFIGRDSCTHKELVSILTHLGIFRDYSKADLAIINRTIDRYLTDTTFSVRKLESKVINLVTL